ncbi:hypothetical protein MAPG_10473 [Magnaporthiopsis poae ATCC 64411]|uniref:Uncharacterized protein n=1 Tax=Magnaporthiopsis poae (strain ATCC 64411 / 73-15) TaxID=644358 RepID=A0A0C4ECP1_MAGP6|nr:hypothetical protein MAPG_10473 [Magnaporthiopsis poae ATCC 64411]
MPLVSDNEEEVYAKARPLISDNKEVIRPQATRRRSMARRGLLVSEDKDVYANAASFVSMPQPGVSTPIIPRRPRSGLTQPLVARARPGDDHKSYAILDGGPPSTPFLRPLPEPGRPIAAVDPVPRSSWWDKTVPRDEIDPRLGRDDNHYPRQPKQALYHSIGTLTHLTKGMTTKMSPRGRGRMPGRRGRVGSVSIGRNVRIAHLGRDSKAILLRVRKGKRSSSGWRRFIIYSTLSPFTDEPVRADCGLIGMITGCGWPSRRRSWTLSTGIYARVTDATLAW